MRSVWNLLLCALLALNVLAESEYVHAKELIYFYTNYLLEGDVYGRDKPEDAWINQCRVTGRCGFNEFIYYVTTGKRTVGNWPSFIEAPNGRLDVTNAAAVEAAAKKIVDLDYAGGNIVPSRVIQGRGFVALYDAMQEIYEYAEQQANSKGGQAKEAFDKFAPKAKEMRNDIEKLRDGTSQSKLRDELKSAFPNDKNFAVYDKPGGGKYDAITFKDTTITIKDPTTGIVRKSYTVIDIPGTEAANKELQPGGGLRAKWTERIDMFWRDDTRLIHRNVDQPRANRNHAAVVERLKAIREGCS